MAFEPEAPEIGGDEDEEDDDDDEEEDEEEDDDDDDDNEEEDKLVDRDNRWRAGGRDMEGGRPW